MLDLRPTALILFGREASTVLVVVAVSTGVVEGGVEDAQGKVGVLLSLSDGIHKDCRLSPALNSFPQNIFSKNSDCGVLKWPIGDECSENSSA